MYGGYFDEQIAKQARTAISKAISAGKTNMEVQFPPVPNVEEAKFGKVCVCIVLSLQFVCSI